MKLTFIFLLLVVGHRSFSQIDKIKIEKEDTAVYQFPEQSAEYPGGNGAMVQYVKNNLPVPDTSCAGIYGTIYIKFTVSEQGDVGNVSVLRGLRDCPSYDSTVIKAIQAMPKFKPAYLNGKPVKCYFNLPIKIHWQ